MQPAQFLLSTETENKNKINKQTPTKPPVVWSNIKLKFYFSSML